MHHSSVLIRRYAAAGGVVVDPVSDHVLVLLRPGRIGPDGQPEIRLPKGHVEPTEQRSRAALREVREEAGLACAKIVADLGHQTVRFEWSGQSVIRDESYFLMTCDTAEPASTPEKQFELVWLTWDEASRRLTFEAERKWIRRARRRWERRA